MRSKVLLISNIFATILTAAIIFFTSNAFNEMGGIDAYADYYSHVIEYADFLSAYILTMPYLFIAQSSIFVTAILLGWIGWIAKKSAPAKFAAVLYILGALICFYYFTFLAIPVIVLGFIGGSKQKSLNRANTVASPVISE